MTNAALELDPFHRQPCEPCEVARQPARILLLVDRVLLVADDETGSVDRVEGNTGARTRSFLATTKTECGSRGSRVVTTEPIRVMVGGARM